MRTRKSKYETLPGPQSRYRKLPIVGPALDNLLTWYRKQGYAESSIRNNLKSVSVLIQWLRTQYEPALKSLTQMDLVSAYEHFRVQRPDVAGTVRSFGIFLRERKLIPEGKRGPASPSDHQVAAFSSYLAEERGLAASTIAGHKSRLRSFLQFLGFDQDSSVIGKLDLEQIEAFLRVAANTNNRFSLQHIVATLRAFLKHLHAEGLLPRPLHKQIDRPRTYRLERLPRALPWEQLLALLSSIDRSTRSGQRDFTILYLAIQYGLRSRELVRLKLDDIDWRTGILKIAQTKTRQVLHLPLTVEAGKILVQYLKEGRGQSGYRELFLRRKAPIGPLQHTAVHDILEKRIRGSSLEMPLTSTHALRHSLAVHLLRRGVSMRAIGDVLGHRDPESTAIYLRLSVEDLREVGLQVPAGGTASNLNPRGWKRGLPRSRRALAKQPLRGTDFRSGLAGPLREYLEIRRALGRRYACEERMLRRWDYFLYHNHGKIRVIRSEMFHGWALTMPQLSATVRRNHLRVVRNFLLFHARNHPETYIPDLTDFPRPSPHQPPRLVTESEMARVLATAGRLPPSHQNPLRAPTIRIALMLLFCCGLRRGELLRLKLKHFDPTRNLLHIESTKFHKSRLVPVSDSVGQELHDYLHLRMIRQLSVKPENALIWSANPCARNQVYSAPGLANNWQQLCLAAGVLDERGRPPRLHDLRHSFAVAVLQRWYAAGDEAQIQAKLPHLASYLGHVSPVSTHLYLHFTPALRNAASRRLHDYVLGAIGEGGAI